MPVPGRDKYPETYGSPLGSGLGRDSPYSDIKRSLTNDPLSPASKMPRYEAIRKDLESLEEFAHNTNVRVTLLVDNIAGTQPGNVSDIKCDDLSHDHECLYDFISDRICSIRKNLNSINEQLDRL